MSETQRKTWRFSAMGGFPEHPRGLKHEKTRDAYTYTPPLISKTHRLSKYFCRRAIQKNNKDFEQTLHKTLINSAGGERREREGWRGWFLDQFGHILVLLWGSLLGPFMEQFVASLWDQFWYRSWEHLLKLLWGHFWESFLRYVWFMFDYFWLFWIFFV